MEDTPPLEIAPAEQKERTIAALMALFEGLTKDAPVLALLEDAHWIDLDLARHVRPAH